jgi:hypothetical protein
MWVNLPHFFFSKKIIYHSQISTLSDDFLWRFPLLPSDSFGNGLPLVDLVER